MIALQVLSALALAGYAVADDDKCKNDFEVSGAGDVPDCKKIDGKVTIKADGQIDLGSVEEITGDLSLGNSSLNQISASDLTKIGGEFGINVCNSLNNINMPKLKEAGSIKWVTANALSTITFAPLSKADSIYISDTHVNSMDAFDVANPKMINLNNNARLEKFSSNVESIDGNFVLTANGFRNLQVELPKLAWAKDINFNNLSSLSIDSLQVVNNSLKLGYNYFESLSAPNLTKTEHGDLSIISNGELGNMSFPVLKDVGGAVIVANNTKLDKIKGFPKLANVAGSIAIRGNFTDFSFDSLKDVKGTADVTSTTDISDACKDFKKLAPNSQGGDGTIEAKVYCTSDNDQANNSTDTDHQGGGHDTSGSSGSDGDDSDGDKDGAAAGLSANSVAVVGFTVLAGLVSSLL